MRRGVGADGRRHAVLGAAALLAAATVLASCAAPTGAQTAELSTAPTPDQCSQVEDEPLPPNAPVDVLLVDRTASHPKARLSQAIQDKIKQAQANNEVLKLVGVDGKDAQPPVRTMALDPAPGDGSVDAQNARGIALACAQWLATEAPDLLPTEGGSNIMAALQEVARQRPHALWLDSDGVATAGVLDLSKAGFDDSDAVVDELTAEKELPDLTDVPVLWTRLGAVAGGMRQSARTSVQTLWTDILGHAGVRDLQFDNRVDTAGDAQAPASPPLPDDPMPTFPVRAVSLPATVCASVPTDTFFRPDSAVPDPSAAASLADLAQQLNAHPTWTVTVTGHTADFGPQAGQQVLSKSRAQSIAHILEGLGVAASRINAIGVGSSRPAQPEWTAGGRHDLAAATQNRRVEVASGASGVTTTCA